jgi:hypothetical protein
MVVERARIVADHLIVRGDAGADDDVDFCRRSGAMEACGDEDDDILFGNSRCVEAIEQRRQGDAVGRRTGDIANGDGHRPLAFRKWHERLGSDGVIERVIDGQ